MQNVSTSGISLPRQKQAMEAKEQHLETLFNAVDQIKTDLTLCGKGMPESKRPLFESGTDYFSVRLKGERFKKFCTCLIWKKKHCPDGSIRNDQIRFWRA